MWTTIKENQSVGASLEMTRRLEQERWWEESVGTPAVKQAG